MKTKADKLRSKLKAPQLKLYTGKKKKKLALESDCEEELTAYLQAVELQNDASEALNEAYAVLSTAQTAVQDALANFNLATGLVSAAQADLNICLMGPQ